MTVSPALKHTCPLAPPGAEALVRACKAHRTCRDVGYAALRDLGLDNYND